MHISTPPCLGAQHISGCKPVPVWRRPLGGCLLGSGVSSQLQSVSSASFQRQAPSRADRRWAGGWPPPAPSVPSSTFTPRRPGGKQRISRQSWARRRWRTGSRKAGSKLPEIPGTRAGPESLRVGSPAVVAADDVTRSVDVLLDQPGTGVVVPRRTSSSGAGVSATLTQAPPSGRPCAARVTTVPAGGGTHLHGVIKLSIMVKPNTFALLGGSGGVGEGLLAGHRSAMPTLIMTWISGVLSSNSRSRMDCPAGRGRRGAF